MFTPNFLICGGSASGCSQLTAALKQHPDIFLPRNHRPEPHYFYFSDEYAKPLTYYREKYFSSVTGESAIGETSGSYLLGADVPARIASYLPAVKIIIQLRHPTDRTYAGYRATAFHGLENLDFEDALDAEPGRDDALRGRWQEVRPFSYVARSLYAESVEGFRRAFPSDQILILKSEETRHNPRKTFERIFQFLNVDTGFNPIMPPTYTSRSVKDLKVQMRAREILGGQFDLCIDAIEQGKDPSVHVTSETQMSVLSELIDNLHDEVVPMKLETRRRLLRLFKPDIERLDPLVDFDVQDWLV